MLAPLLLELVRNISLLISLVFIQYLIQIRRDKTPAILVIRKSIQGVLVGVIAIILMNNSFVLTPGLIFDTRTILLSISGLYLGPLPTLLACTVAGIYRFTMGGSGMPAGILSILTSGTMGIIAGKIIFKDMPDLSWWKNIIFGFAVQFVVILIFLAVLPHPTNREVAAGTAFPFLLIYPLITAVIGKILAYQTGSWDFTQKLAESNALHRSLFFDNQSIMLLADPSTGGIIDANQAAADYYGWTVADLKNMNIRDLRVADEETVAETLEAIRGENLNFFQAVHRRADGSLRDVEIHTNLINYRNKPLIMSILHDITQRNRTERLLLKSEFQLSRAELISNLGHWELDLEKNEFNASKGAVTIYGAEGIELKAQTVQAIPLPEYREMMNRAMADLISGKSEYDINFRIKRVSDAEIRYIHSVAEYNCEDNTVFGVIRDITENVVARNALIEEKERLDVTLHSIGDGVITTDREGRIRELNPVAEELTGWSIEDARGRPLPEVFRIIDEYSKRPRKNPAEIVFETGKIVELANHTVLINHDGKELIISDSGAPIRDRYGEIIGIILVFRDTTEKQILQNRLQRAERLESLGVLAGGIAHDFNNLLTGIYGYLEMAKSISTEDAVIEYLNSAFQVYKRTIDLTKQLLTFSKGSLPERNIEDLTTLIQNSVKFSLSGSLVSCRMDLEEGLHSCNLDKNQIGQVMDNLLINAQQAMPGGGTIRIEAENIYLEAQAVQELPEGHYVRVSVSDSGSGIPTDILPRIFDPFFTTKELGNGLGLATCYSILEKHDGAIDVKSSSQGTTFQFYLPATEKPSADSSKERSEKYKSSGNILVMDDEFYIRDIVKRMLESMNFSVTVAKDGEEMLMQLEESSNSDRKFRAAIMDLTVPGGMGGVETLQNIRAMGYNFPAFASSGYSEDPVISSPGIYGFTGSISKPFILEDLSRLLAKHLE